MVVLSPQLQCLKLLAVRLQVRDERAAHRRHREDVLVGGHGEVDHKNGGGDESHLRKVEETWLHYTREAALRLWVFYQT